MENFNPKRNLNKHKVANLGIPGKNKTCRLALLNLAFIQRCLDFKMVLILVPVITCAS